MKKFKRVLGLLIVLSLSFIFTGCGVEDKKSEDKTEVNNESVRPETSKEALQKSTEAVSITEQPVVTTDSDIELPKLFLTTKNGVKDMDAVFRNPDSYKGKEFTFGGQVVKSETTANGAQQVVIGLYTSMEMLPLEDNSIEFEKFIKVNYDVAGFGGTRLVQGDTVGIIVTFKEIVNDAQYGGDTLLFEAKAYSGVISYWGIKCIDQYYASLNVDVSTMNLKQIEVATEEEFINILGSEGSFEFDYNTSRIFTVNNDGYLVVQYTKIFEEPDEYGYQGEGILGIKLYSGKKDENENFVEKTIKEFYGWEFIEQEE